MTRLFITSLLTLAYLFGQLATPPHAHGSSRVNEPADHDARPHFHFSVTSHGGHRHDLEHDHEDAHSHHHDCDELHTQPVSAAADAECDDHDSDAIYLPNGPGFSLPTKCDTVPVCLTVFSNFAIATIATPPEYFPASTEANFPDKCSPHCALYLALRTLRI